ncbi:MAG: amidohydrolase family protein, partial [Gammaproteobacteria bacterium]|nr:amidohydrolase family protein [Gammaproteobacteria bacterium]
GTVTESARRNLDREINARGRALAPGFVDTHNHGALGGTRRGDAGLPLACELALRGGVTRRLCGVDGLSPAPVVPAQRVDYAAQLKPLDGAIDGDWTWSSVAEFQAWYRGRSVTDMGLYLGHSAVRRAVMGNQARRAQESELNAMCELVRREAPLTLGLSTGLVYNPAVYSDQPEIAALVRAFNDVRPAALFPHLRSESDRVVEALTEVVQAAIEGGGGYCNEHSKIAGRDNYHKMGALEDVLRDASTSIPTMENMYPYTAGSTTGDAIFPPDVRAGTRADFLARLADPQVRDALYVRLRGDTTTWDNFVHFCGGLEGVQIAGVRTGVGDDFLGNRLADVARAAGHTDLESREAYEAVFDFYIANGGEIGIITHYGNEPTVERFFRRPTMAVCTDGLMPGPGQKPHPRAIGAFPKALRMAREMGIALEEIVYRMSVLPCRFLGLDDPVLAPGADASLVLFDWQTVRERNDYLDPLVPPHGIDAVWVHGELVLDHGQLVAPARYPGRILLPARGEGC